MNEEEEIAELKAVYEKERERLAKLWDAYEVQEEELEREREDKEKISKEADEKTRIFESLNEMIEKRDKQLREQEVLITSMKKEIEKYDKENKDLKEKFDAEREKVKGFFEGEEDVENDFVVAVKAIKARDKWFFDNLGVLEQLAESVPVRKDMIVKKSFEIPEKKETKLEEKEEEKELPEKKNIVDLFVTIPGIGPKKAEALYDEGYTSVELLKEAKPAKLSDVLSPTLVKAVQKAVKKM